MQDESDRIRLSIVIPAFNEEGKIHRDVQNARQFLVRELSGSGEIIVVDDGSTDGTADRVRSLADGSPSIRLIRYSPRRGKGHALRAGVSETRGEFVMFADAGSCVPYDNALRGLELCEAGVHLAHGSRCTPGSSILDSRPAYRRLGSSLFRILARTLLRGAKTLTDTQCGFKVYRGSCARKLYASAFTNGFMFDIEIIRRARQQGLRVVEFPVQWKADRDTKYRPGSGTIRNLSELIMIKLRC